MSDKKYTKGPWTFVKGKFNGGAGSSTSGIGSIKSDYEGFYICEVEDADEHQANANLIAAAPELLEALELLNGHAKMHMKIAVGVSEFIDSAIAKAHGEIK